MCAEIFSSQHPGSTAAPGNNSATPANSSARCLVASVGTDSRCVDIRLESDDTCYLWTEFEIIKMTIYETCAI